ncbi:MAG: hypothetical protein QM765_25300 [Myxococcales bacterium]
MRLEDGSRALALRHTDGTLELQHLTDDGAPTVLHLPGPALSARIVGASGRVACARTERASATANAIERRLICLDLATAATSLDVELGTPGLYMPRRELAVGAGSVAFIRPEESGLRVTVRRLPTGGGR